MPRHFKWCVAPLFASLVALQSCNPSQAGDPSIRWARLFPHKVDDVGKRPATGKDCCVEELARNIDWLEHHINMNGTVVAKTPDVSGEARLTAHRQEFEQVLADELRAFDKSRINGAEFVSDQSFLAFALALNARSGPTANLAPVPNITQNANSNGGPGTPSITQSFTGPTSPFGYPGSFDFKNDIKLEQTEILDQLANYVNHLHALRRNNEGPDTADAPGYAMNLLRIPVSILPGQNTQKGYGAEITVTIEPYLGQELLPATFRELVTNDVIDQLALPIAQYINSDPAAVKKQMAAIEVLRKPDPNSASPFLKKNLRQLYYIAKYTYAANAVAKDEFNLASPGPDTHTLALAIQKLPGIRTDNIDVDDVSAIDAVISHMKPDESSATFRGKSNSEALTDLTRTYVNPALKVCEKMQALHSASSATRRSTFPFPPSQLDENFGRFELAEIVSQVYEAFKDDLANREVVHVSDLQAYLREEMASAYELLSQTEMHVVWEMESPGPEGKLAELVRTRNVREISRRRNQFESVLRRVSGQDAVAGHLAWCLYMNALLLNERLVKDIERTYANTPNTPPAPGWMAYYEPNPAPEARQAFAEYVKVRWPIHVFALDPVINEQNIADVRSIYRQMQMSVAVAYAAGNIGTSAALQAMRKLQRDRATIDLKRTAIAFEHGDDTFGWRFTPRFQTPPVEGNATVFFRDLVCGGPTDQQLLKSERMEPGVRECSALIIMPSFVPHVTLHTRGNWYKLNAPTRSGDSVHDTVHYSRAVKQMEQNAQLCCQCAHLYRDGEVDRLLKRVHQIDRKLALQTLECQVPIENTHGGFEILTNGKRELAPELSGWYGSPGYDPDKGTTMFLSGESFSVTKSRLIVGNQAIHGRLLSRQVMEVHLPPGLAVMRDRNLDKLPSEQYQGYVDAQVASPYGVSGHLFIPVVRPSSVLPQVITLRAAKLKIKAKVGPRSTGSQTDRNNYELKGYSFPPVVTQILVDTPKDSGLLHRANLQGVLLTKQDSSRLINIDPFVLTRTDDGFVAADDFFAKQFADTTTATKLGGIIGNHLNYLLQNGQAPAGGKVNYQLGMAVSTYAAAEVPNNPVSKVAGAIEIEISFIEPVAVTAVRPPVQNVVTTVDGAPAVVIAQKPEQPAAPKAVAAAPAPTPLFSSSLDSQFQSKVQVPDLP